MSSTRALRRVFTKRRVAIVAVSVAATSIITAAGVLFSDDPISTPLRAHIQARINSEIDALYLKVRDGQESSADRVLLRGTVASGIAVGWFSYPEASAILFHYVYGDGSELRLSADYFRRSGYLQEQVRKLGPGEHGPVGFEQARDWRLSLALNPFYLKVESDRILLFHPKIDFVASSGPPTRTIVPIGKLRIRFYDNLVNALDPTPFPVFAEWKPTEEL